MNLIIITVNLNDSRGLCKTFNSVYPIRSMITEHIIVDGKSIDNSYPIAKQYKSRSSYAVRIIHEPDKGIYDAMNKGINLIRKGINKKYVLFLNSGDEFSCSELEYFKKTLKYNAELIFYNARVVYNDISYIRPRNQSNNFYEKETPVHQSVLFNLSKLRGKQYDLSFKVQADSKLIYELIKESNDIKYFPIVICNFYYGGLSSNYLNYRKCIQQLAEQIFIMTTLNKKAMLFILTQFIFMNFKYFLRKVLGERIFAKFHFFLIRRKL
jgi:putative colanic acid biosynthesis glycosyltransferase